MRDQYTRLIKATDFQDTAYDYMGFNTVNNIDVPDTSENLQGLKEQVVNKDDVDFLKLSKVIQKVFFDLYGTNLPKDRLDEVISELPTMIPNQIEMFELLVTKTLRTLKVFEWVDTQIDDEFTAPEQLQQEVDEIVDSGNTGDLNKPMLDDALENEEVIQYEDEFEDEDFNDEDEFEDEDDEDELDKRSAKARAIAQKALEAEIVNAKLYNERRASNQPERVKQKRSVQEAGEYHRHLLNKCYDRQLKAKQTQQIVYKKMQADLEALEGFDIGLGKGGIRRATGRSGGGGGVDSGWFDIIQSGDVQRSGPLGLPTIDCDSIGGV